MIALDTVADPAGVAPLIEAEACANAAALLDALAPRKSRWGPDPRRWAFRGHGDARWVLVPSAVRPDAAIGGEGGLRRGLGPLPTNALQAQAELNLLEEFLREANRQGLPLPAAAEAFWGDDAALRRDFYDAFDNKAGKGWPPPALVPLLALAQHHGIATRLLDWTEDARVAAYFAAVVAAPWATLQRGLPDGCETLEVWAVRWNAVARVGTVASTEHPEKPTIQFRSAIAATNRNLFAQRGMFSVVVDHSGRNTRHAATDVRPLDEVTRDLVASIGAPWRKYCQVPDGPLFRRLTLPVREAPPLLRLLAYEGVTGRAIYPGFDGVVRGIRERHLWDGPVAIDE